MKNQLRLCLFFVFCALTMTGCASMDAGLAQWKGIANPTAESLSDSVAAMLGVRPAQVAVSDIESRGNKTYFVATTPNGSYNCAVDSGMLIALTADSTRQTCATKNPEKKS